jgi:hypothetical protein
MWNPLLNNENKKFVSLTERKSILIGNIEMISNGKILGGAASKVSCYFYIKGV